MRRFHARRRERVRMVRVGHRWRRLLRGSIECDATATSSRDPTTMDLKSGYPYWAIKNGLMYAFPRLEADAACDVLIIGAGITGALIARRLAAEHLDVIVVDERDIAWGSTAASTALLQYEIDTHMTELARR